MSEENRNRYQTWVIFIISGAVIPLMVIIGTLYPQTAVMEEKLSNIETITTEIKNTQKIEMQEIHLRLEKLERDNEIIRRELGLN